MSPDRIYNKSNPAYFVEDVTYRNFRNRGSITFEAKDITNKLCVVKESIVTFSPGDYGHDHDYKVVVVSTDYIECERI